MAQTPKYQVPAHPAGLDMRTQLNAIILALIGDNSGPTAPAEMYPGMMWGDTTAARLRRRNNANTGWIDIGPLDDFLGDLRTQIAGVSGKYLSKTGDTGTWLTLNGFDPAGGGQMRFNQGAYGAMFRNDGNMFYTLLTNPNDPNGAFNSLRPFQIALASGVVSMGQGLTVSGGTVNINGGRLYLRQPGNCGEMAMMSTDGTAMYMRGRASAGGMEWVNNVYNAVVAYMDDGGNVQFNQINSRGNLVSASNVYAGAAILSPDGNINGSVWGGWLSNWMNNKAATGAQCPWNSGIAEFASAMGGANVSDSVSPWVMEGVRVTTSTDINRIYPRCVWLRNQ